MSDFHLNREKMVRETIEARGVCDPKVLQVMRNTPRHLFVSEALQNKAYGDYPLPIGDGQTISQPYIVAYMTELLQLNDEHKVLEIGTGSGFQTAILAQIAFQVLTIERFRDHSVRARELFDILQLSNISQHVGDGSMGWKSWAPFDRIIVTASAPIAPDRLKKQLASDGGRLVMPVGDVSGQHIVLIVRNGDDYCEQRLIPCSFVPLVGKYGWKE